MATVVNDLVTKFGFQGSVSPLNDYNATLGGSISLLGKMYLGLNTAAGAFAYWADSVLTGVDSLGALSRQTKVAVGTIQELSYAAEQTQSTGAAMRSTLSSLSRTIGDAAQKGSEDFARLGISVRDAGGQVKGADQILEEVRQRFRSLNLSMQEQETFASALGIDSSLLQLLNKSNAEMAGLRDRARELGTLTAEQTEQAEDYKKSLNSMWFSLNAVKQLVAVGVAPEFARMADSFAQLLADNRDWIVGGIQFTVKWVGNLLAALNRLLPVFALIAAGFVAMKIATLGWAGAMAVVLSPIVLITAAVAALLLIVDDLIVAFQGGKSVIADFFQDTFGIDIVETLTKAFQTLRKYAIDPLIEGFKLLWDYWLRIVGAIKSGGTTVARLLGIDIDTSASGAGSGGPVDNRRVDQSNQINIYTNDPQAAGRAVGDTLQQQLDAANTQLSGGGR